MEKILIMIMIVFAAMYTVYSANHKGKMVLFIKTLASSSFFISSIIFYNNIQNNGLTSYNFEMFVVIALFFALLGDVFLALMKIVKKEPKRFLILGILSFMTAHINFLIYIILINGIDIVNKTTVLALVIAIIFAFINIKISKKYKFNFKGAKVGAITYIAVLSYTVTISLITYIFGNTEVLLICGLINFIISDLLLSFIYFHDNKHKKVLGILNHITYYAAVIMITISILY